MASILDSSLQRAHPINNGPIVDPSNIVIGLGHDGLEMDTSGEIPALDNETRRSGVEHFSHPQEACGMSNKDPLELRRPTPLMMKGRLTSIPKEKQMELEDEEKQHSDAVNSTGIEARDKVSQSPQISSTHNRMRSLSRSRTRYIRGVSCRSGSRSSRILRRISRRHDTVDNASISDKSHPEYELTCDMMLGIRHTVGQAPIHPLDQLANVEDFSEEHSYRFPQEGSATTPAHAMRSFKFKDYQPAVYRSLRNRFGIDTADYLLCLCGDEHYLEFIANSKSGQFFFYSHDRQFMIKTLTHSESRFLRHILPQYYRFIMQHPDTLLTRFYGMHRVKPHKGKKMHFIIMASVFYTDRFIHEVYDIKGSTMGRRATSRERRQETPVLKDLDFIDNKIRICIGQKKAHSLICQLQADTGFLKDLDIMDYSLLLGIHYTDKSNTSTVETDDPQGHRRRQSNYGLKSWQQVVASPYIDLDGDGIVEEESHGRPFTRSSPFEHGSKGVSTFCENFGGCRAIVDGVFVNRVYFFGIIDILQRYNSKKRMEHSWKSFKFDRNTISAVQPNVYANRFVEFLKRAIADQ